MPTWKTNLAAAALFLLSYNFLLRQVCFQLIKDESFSSVVGSKTSRQQHHHMHKKCSKSHSIYRYNDWRQEEFDFSV